jgi:hypothetical protein
LPRRVGIGGEFPLLAITVIQNMMYSLLIDFLFVRGFVLPAKAQKLIALFSQNVRTSQQYFMLLFFVACQILYMIEHDAKAHLCIISRQAKVF